MKYLVFALTLAYLVFDAYSQEQKIICPRNEVFYECKPCVKSCETLYTPVFCTLACFPGCACAPGFVKDSSNKCIPKKWCPSKEIKCPNNLIYLCCGEARTCTNPNPKLEPTCKPGCYCPYNMVLNVKTGVCIPKEKCPKVVVDC